MRGEMVTSVKPSAHSLPGLCKLIRTKDELDIEVYRKTIYTAHGLLSYSRHSTASKKEHTLAITPLGREHMGKHNGQG